MSCSDRLLLSAACCVLLLSSAPSRAQTLHGFVEKSVTVKEGDTQRRVKYRLRSPSRMEKGKKYPLIFFLHGAGERGSENKAQMRHFPELWRRRDFATQFDVFVLAPQCRREKKWVDVPWSTTTSSPLPKQSSADMRAALAALDATIKAYPVDTSRIYLTGLSMGGYGSWYLAARYPKRFAAVGPVCGGGPEANAKNLAGVPIWAWHGDADRSVPVARTRNMIAAIRKAGGTPKYTELKGVAHDSWVQAYQPGGLLRWMLRQRRAIR